MQNSKNVFCNLPDHTSIQTLIAGTKFGQNPIMTVGLAAI